MDTWPGQVQPKWTLLFYYSSWSGNGLVRDLSWDFSTWKNKEKLSFFSDNTRLHTHFQLPESAIFPACLLCLESLAAIARNCGDEGDLTWGGEYIQSVEKTL